MQQNLDGHLALGGPLKCLIDDALPALAELADDFVAFDGYGSSFRRCSRVKRHLILRRLAGISKQFVVGR